MTEEMTKEMSRGMAKEMSRGMTKELLRRRFAIGASMFEPRALPRLKGVCRGWGFFTPQSS